MARSRVIEPGDVSVSTSVITSTRGSGRRGGHGKGCGGNGGCGHDGCCGRGLPMKRSTVGKERSPHITFFEWTAF